MSKYDDNIALELARKDLDLKRLQEENKTLREQLQISHEAISDLSQQMRLVQEQMLLFRRNAYGARSEKISNIIDDSLQPQLFEFPDGTDLPDDQDSPEKPDDVAEKVKTKRRRKATKEQTMHNLPEWLFRELHVIEPKEKAELEAEGKVLVEIDRRVVEKLAAKPLELYVKRYEYPKYKVVGEVDQGLFEAPAVEAPIEKSKADCSLLVFIAMMKSCFHLPLYRIQEFFRQCGIEMSRQTLCNYYLQTAEVLEPLAEAIRRQVFIQNIIYADETTCKYPKINGPGLSTGYYWVCEAGTGPPYRYYKFTDSREHQHAFEMFKDYKGNIMADGYGAYQTLDEDPQYDCALHCCWAHVRRKFIESSDGDLVLRDRMLLLITRLYRWEKLYWKTSAREERRKIREKKMEPLIDAIFSEAKHAFLEGNILPKSKLYKALQYMLKREVYLRRFLENEDMRIDNNTAERALRPIAIGRKNWLFAGSIRGGEATATLMTIIQSCRAMNVDPNAYLKIILNKIQTYPASRIDELLPHHYMGIPHKQLQEKAAA